MMTIEHKRMPKRLPFYILASPNQLNFILNFKINLRSALDRESKLPKESPMQGLQPHSTKDSEQLQESCSIVSNPDLYIS